MLCVPVGFRSSQAASATFPTSWASRGWIGASWFNTDVTNIGTFKIAQVTLSADAAGSLGGTTYDAGTAGVGVEYSAEILNGLVVPEPATLGLLLAAASAAGMARRRPKR